MYQDRDWLYEEYTNKKRSTTSIAKQLDVSHKTICRWLRKHGIEVRDVKTALDIKYGNNQNTKLQRAIEYYVKSQAVPIKSVKPNLNWKEGK